MLWKEPTGPGTPGGELPATSSAVVAKLRELIELRVAARSIDLDALRVAKAHAMLAGPYRSAQRGRGVEFDEVRPYQPGDDVRSIDWRVSARTGRTYSKLFHDERELPVLLLADAGASMRFGTRDCFKSVAAARAAATLAWAAHQAGDRLGGVVSSARASVALPAQRRPRHLLAWLDAVARATAEPGDQLTDLEAVAGRLTRLAPAGSHVILVSDFYGLDDASQAALATLARHRHVSCIQVYDVLEAEPPPAGRYRVSDGRRVNALDTGAAAGREAWGAHFQARREALRRLCGDHRIPLLSLRTDQALPDVIGRRRGRPRS